MPLAINTFLLPTRLPPERTPFERLIVEPEYTDEVWASEYYGPNYYWAGPYWVNPLFPYDGVPEGYFGAGLVIRRAPHFAYHGHGGEYRAREEVHVRR